MKTIKLIDLLNKIANGEELPKKIKFHGSIFELKRKYSYCEDYYSKGLRFLFNDEWALTNNLNDEVEIIEEEKEIEPLTKLGNYKVVNTGDDFLDKVLTNINERINHLIDKQTELIDAVNEMRKEK